MIVACKACDSRYDVSGREAGAQLKCRCGSLIAIEKSSHVSLLACPKCGAGVSPQDNRCEYCQCELLLKSCPRCLSRVFHAHKHCPSCGAGLEKAAAGTTGHFACPRCTAPMHARLIGDVLVDECTQCLGHFVDYVAVERLIADRQQSRADALLGALPRPEKNHLAPVVYIKCPVCTKLMNRTQFAYSSGVVIDTCKPHGAFFDKGELPAVIEFVMKGGLEKAARSELEREKQRLRDEKEKWEAQKYYDQAYQSGNRYARYSSDSGAFSDFLSKLFG